MMALSVHIKKRLRDFSLSVDFELENDITGLLGASGCGKSMTLKCIAGIETPDEGRIVLNGRVLFDREKRINLSPQKRRVGYLFQNYALFPNYTVRGNVEAGFCKRKLTREQKREKVDGLLRQFHIEEIAEEYPSRISGGQQQRVALARMMAAEPEFLLLDEPFCALDSYLREKLMQEMITCLSAYQKGVILVSHSRDEIYQMCGKAAIMHRGTLEVLGQTKEIFKNPVTVNGARLTGCKNISQAVRTGEHTIYAKAWDMELTVAGEIPENLSHVGIRAHSLKRVKETGKNVMNCHLERISEAPFEEYFLLKNESGKETELIWWKVSKEEWKISGEKIPEKLYFPPEDILLLTEGENEIPRCPGEKHVL